MHTLGAFLSATAQLHPKVNIKQIVIALIDRLASYAAREAETEDPEEIKRQEEAASRRLAEKVKNARLSGRAAKPSPQSPVQDGSSEWSTVSPTVEPTAGAPVEKNDTSPNSPNANEKGKEKEGSPIRKFRGIPENVKLFEVFWEQIVALIKACRVSCPECTTYQTLGPPRSFYSRYNRSSCLANSLVPKLLS